MIAASDHADGLIAELQRQGVTLEVVGDRLRYSPVDAVTSRQLDELRRLKGAVVSKITARDFSVGRTSCPHCRRGQFRDIPVHAGRSIRRDCARCGRFIVFPVWYGKKTLVDDLNFAVTV